MSKKMSGSEKLLFNCDKNGKRSLADFENVEEALQATGGMYSFRWEKLGQPPRFYFNQAQSYNPAQIFEKPIVSGSQVQLMR